MRIRNCFAVVALLAGPCALAETIDQSFYVAVSDPGPSYIAYQLDTRAVMGQTFTAGLEGTLTRVGLQLARSSTAPIANLDIEIWSVQGSDLSAMTGPLGVLSASSAVLPVGAVFGFPPLTFFDFSLANIAQRPGDQFAVLVRSDAPPSASPTTFEFIFWRAGLGSGYAGGSIIYQPAGSGFSFLNPDGGFQTWVQATPVPEPTMASMCILGILSLWGVTAVRRKHPTRAGACAAYGSRSPSA